MKRWPVFAGGLVAGVSFVLACNHAGSKASAAPNDCAVWQFANQDSLNAAKQITTIDVGGGYQGGEINGWEPFAASADGSPVFRRCKP